MEYILYSIKAQAYYLDFPVEVYLLYQPPDYTVFCAKTRLGVLFIALSSIKAW
jgi:hypothetical protein